MKKIRILSVIMCLVLAVAIFASCSAKANMDSDFSGGYYGDSFNSSTSADDMIEKPSVEESFDGIKADGSLSDSAPSDSGQYERKIIKTVNITAETKSFDAAISAINDYVSRYGGYVEGSEVSGKSLDYYGRYYERYARYTIRVPAENLDAFLGDVGETLNIVKNHGTIDDVSPQYYDIVSRLETLETEKTALQKMYEQAETIDYMLQVQQRLYDVIEEIESYTTKLNYYNSQVAYSTVHLTVDEVVEYTEIQEEPETYGERIARAFTESWEDFADGCRDFSVDFVYAIPTLLVLAVIGGGIAAVVIIIIKNAKKKKAANTPADSEQN